MMDYEFLDGGQTIRQNLEPFFVGHQVFESLGQGGPFARDSLNCVGKLAGMSRRQNDCLAVRGAFGGDERTSGVGVEKIAVTRFGFPDSVGNVGF